MFLKNLKLTNFRNFSKVDLDFGPVTLFVGNNAQGKSNLLESIYFLATTKSPRADKDIQLIKEGEEFVRIEGEMGDMKLEIVMQKRVGQQTMDKRVKVNGVPRRVTDYIGNLVVVHFSPEDINLVTGPPALRRWHIDLTLAQIDKEYKNALNEYHTALISRNKILKGIKEGTSKVAELDFWSGKMIENGAVISGKRRNLFEFLNTHITSDDLGHFRFVYQENNISEERLREYLAREIAASSSLIGPHRDDFTFKLDGKDLEYFGSRGEQRTAVLELKLGELKFFSEVKKTLPLLLLDDVFSELDEVHRDFITSVISNQSFGLAQGGQAVLSAVEEAQVPKKLLKEAKVVKVQKGKLSFLREICENRVSC